MQVTRIANLSDQEIKTLTNAGTTLRNILNEKENFDQLSQSDVELLEALKQILNEVIK